MKTKEKKKIINDYNILGVNIQFILTILVLLFGIISIFAGKTFFIIFEFLVAFDLFTMAFNNERIYKREKATTLYLISGIGMILCGILSIIGVI